MGRIGSKHTPETIAKMRAAHQLRAGRSLYRPPMSEVRRVYDLWKAEMAEASDLLIVLSQHFDGTPVVPNPER